MRPPRRNLPPDAEPWGRWVEDNVNSLGQTSIASDQGTLNGLGAVNGALQQLSGQIAAVASAQTAANAAIDATNAAVAAQQVSVTTQSFTASSFTVTNTSFANKATASIATPVGATAMLLIGSGSFRVTKPSSTASDRYIESRAVVNGVIAADLPAAIITSGMTVGNSTATGGSFSSWTGLAGIAGTSLPFAWQTQSSASHDGAGFITGQLTAIFYRFPLS